MQLSENRTTSRCISLLYEIKHERQSTLIHGTSPSLQRSIAEFGLTGFFPGNASVCKTSFVEDLCEQVTNLVPGNDSGDNDGDSSEENTGNKAGDNQTPYMTVNIVLVSDALADAYLN